MDTRTDEDLLAAIVDELTASRPPFDVTIEPHTAFALAAVVQLALRHPGANAAAVDAGQRYLAAVRRYFVDCPAVLEVLRRGDDRSFDHADRKRNSADH